MSENEYIRGLELRCMELENIAKMELEEKFQYLISGEKDEFYRKRLEARDIEVYLTSMYAMAYSLATDAVHYLSANSK